MSQENSNLWISKEDGLRTKIDMRRPAVAMAAHHPLAADLAGQAGFDAARAIKGGNNGESIKDYRNGINIVSRRAYNRHRLRRARSACS